MVYDAKGNFVFEFGEIIEQMWLAYKVANTIFKDESALRIEFDNWINQNL